MKTEKRLTMALSVLVALMMLAVPLASSSNLFVDGGQTNSNGDAPLIGENESQSTPTKGYTITFQLNNSDMNGRISLDVPTITTTSLSDVTWYTNEDGNLCAAVTGNLEISALIGGVSVSKVGYTFDSWNYENKKWDSSTAPDDYIKSDMTFSANWNLDPAYVQIPVDVTFDGTDYKYVKAYALLSDGKTVTINPDSLIALMPSEISNKGYVLNGSKTGADVEVYTYTVKDVAGEINKDKPVNSNNTVSIIYTLKSFYNKISISSIAFGDEKIVMYAYNKSDFEYITYADVWEALTNDSNNFPLKGASPNADGSYTTSDKKYNIIDWDNSILLKDIKSTPGNDLTLNAVLNSYNVLFMVNGEYEIVEVFRGALSVDSCTMDISGVDHWVKYTYDSEKSETADKYKFEAFNFSTSDISNIESSTITPGTPAAYLIACFTKTDKTAYAIFDAGDANFGSKYVHQVILPGNITSDNKKSYISTPSSDPKFTDDMTLFLGWETGGSQYTSSNEYPKSANGITVYTTNSETYEHVITFYVDNNLIGALYYTGALSEDNNKLKGSVVGFELDGKLYPMNDTTREKAIKALMPEKSGYTLLQWNDADGKKVFSIYYDKENNLVFDAEFPSDGIKTDLSLYAEFDAAEYVIIYSGNTAAATNNMIQVGTVGESLNFFSDSTFSNDGYKLKEWNTRPDGKGTTYALGSAYTLSGADYDKLSKISDKNGNIPTGIDHGFTLYAIWEKVGSSDNPSGNTDGDNDNSNNTDTYLLAGILVVIIILIIVVAVVLRKKN